MNSLIFYRDIIWICFEDKPNHYISKKLNLYASELHILKDPRIREVFDVIMQSIDLRLQLQ